jgi:hypothetical protein
VCVEMSIQSLVARAFENGASKCRLSLSRHFKTCFVDTKD